MLSEKQEALQAYFFPKYRDLLLCILYCGGCVLHSQMSRLLFNNKSDSNSASILVENLTEARIIRKTNFGRNKIYILTYGTLTYFGLQFPSAKPTTSRVKLSALIFESYLQKGYYKKPDPAAAMRQKLEKSCVLRYQVSGKVQLTQMLYLRDEFKQRGYKTDGINYQIERMKTRVASGYMNGEGAAARFLPKESDMFSISCKNIFLAGVAIRPNEYGRERPVALVDVYHNTRWNPRMMANNLIEAKRVIEDTLQNDALAQFTIHSHSAYNPDFENKVYNLLSAYPEFLNSEQARNEIAFRWYDTRESIFSGIDPDALY